MIEYFYYFTIYYYVLYKSLEDIIAYMTQFTFTKNVILLTILLISIGKGESALKQTKHNQL